ncbi:YndM family protein [Virgibacillus necropolis]|uniref:YndM family protein n=1 Tax=Virgibacillus necropolis TaxID=163877 RepID=UPI00384F9278
MEHVKALGIKFIFTAIVVYSIFGIFYNASLGRLFWISLLVTGVSYVIGDLYILPRSGNILASIADLGLAFLSLWVLANIIIEMSIPTVMASIMASVVIAFCESLFHAYMQEKVINTREETRHFNQLQTEFAEETNEDTINKDRDKSKKDT